MPINSALFSLPRLFLGAVENKDVHFLGMRVVEKARPAVSSSAADIIVLGDTSARLCSVTFRDTLSFEYMGCRSSFPSFSAFQKGAQRGKVVVVKVMTSYHLYRIIRWGDGER
jgi:hypothetical protein